MLMRKLSGSRRISLKLIAVSRTSSWEHIFITFALRDDPDLHGDELQFIGGIELGQKLFHHLNFMRLALNFSA